MNIRTPDLPANIRMMMRDFRADIRITRRMISNICRMAATDPLKNERHELFVQGVALGKPKWRAWQDSAEDSRRKPRRQTATQEAGRVIALPNVRARLAFIAGEAQSTGIVSRDEMLHLASQGARDTDQPLRDRLSAMALIARCQGYDLPEDSNTVRPDGLTQGDFAALVLTAKADAASMKQSEVIEQQNHNTEGVMQGTNTYSVSGGGDA